MRRLFCSLFQLSVYFIEHDVYKKTQVKLFILLYIFLFTLHFDELNFIWPHADRILPNFSALERLSRPGLYTDSVANKPHTRIHLARSLVTPGFCRIDLFSHTPLKQLYCLCSVVHSFTTHSFSWL